MHDAQLLAQLRDGRAMIAAICDECTLVPSVHTPRIQEADLVAWHHLCHLVEGGGVHREKS